MAKRLVFHRNRKIQASIEAVMAKNAEMLAESGLLAFPPICRFDTKHPDELQILSHQYLRRDQDGALILESTIGDYAHHEAAKFKKMRIEGKTGLSFLDLIVEHEIWDAPLLLDLRTEMGMKLGDELIASVRDPADVMTTAIRKWLFATWREHYRSKVPDLKEGIRRIVDRDRMRFTRLIARRSPTVADYNYISAENAEALRHETRPISLEDLAKTHFAAMAILCGEDQGHWDYSGTQPISLGDLAKTNFAAMAILCQEDQGHLDYNETYSPDHEPNHWSIGRRIGQIGLTFKLRRRAEEMPRIFAKHGLKPRVWRAIARANKHAALAMAKHAHGIVRGYRGDTHRDALNSLALMKPEKMSHILIDSLMNIMTVADARIAHTIANKYNSLNPSPGEDNRMSTDMLERFRLALGVYDIADLLEAAHRDRRIIPSNISYEGLKGLSDEWHDWVIENEHNTKRYSWPPILGARGTRGMSYRKHWITELTSSEELINEGKLMSNCVRTYDSDCAEGKCRIFHIEYESTHHSTLELAYQESSRKWTVDQLKGIHNSGPPESHATIAQYIADLANASPTFDASKPVPYEVMELPPQPSGLPSPLARYPQRPQEALGNAIGEFGECIRKLFSA